MFEGFRTSDRKDRQVWGLIADRVGADPFAVSTAWSLGSQSARGAHRAAEIVGLGYFFLAALADSASNTKTRRFYKRLHPEAGARAAVWVAHCLSAPWPGAPTKPEFAEARRLLSAHFPLPADEQIHLDALIGRSQGELGVDPRTLFPHFTRHALVLAIGEEETALLPLFNVDAGLDAMRERFVLDRLWGRGGTMLIDLMNSASARRLR